MGGDILKRVNFPYPVEDIVRFHHEKWDGSGYPRGLRAEKIPLVARIISVVDFYDATRCDRPYRKGMKREDSLGVLQKMSGTSFDPKVVDVCSACHRVRPAHQPGRHSGTSRVREPER